MKRYVFILKLFCFFIAFFWVLYCYITFYNRSNNNFYIKIDKPSTNYIILNKIINKKIKKYRSEFCYDIKHIDIPVNFTSTLIITYDLYDSNNFLSYVFYIERYTGGAHPVHDIWTVNYDKINNRIVNIDDLILIDNDILNKFSKISRERLIYNKRIVNASWLYSGTSGVKDNFKLFVLTDNSIILFFLEYQIAPYSSSSFSLEIDYDDIDL